MIIGNIGHDYEFRFGANWKYFVTNINIKYIESANKKDILIIYLRMLHMQQIHVTKQVLHSKRHIIVLVIVPTPNCSVVTGF